MVGTKYGCGVAEGGTCTILVDGQATCSCVQFEAVTGSPIMTSDVDPSQFVVEGAPPSTDYGLIGGLWFTSGSRPVRKATMPCASSAPPRARYYLR